MNVRNNKGFSLVELMVVVAIIGILAAVAIPQFSKFQARSRQSEAKAHLSGIYTAEKSFQAEWSSYYEGLLTVGYGPSGGVAGQSGLRYNAGFAAITGLPAGATAQAGDQPHLGAGTMCRNNANAAAACVAAANYNGLATAPGAAYTAGVDTFVAVAQGNPNSRVAGNVDVWTITQAKDIRNATPGID